MKKIWLTGIAAVLSLSVCACGNSSEGNATTANVTETEETSETLQGENSSETSDTLTGTEEEETTLQETETASDGESSSGETASLGEDEVGPQLSEEDAAMLQSYLGGKLDIASVRVLSDKNKKKIQQAAKEEGYIVEFSGNKPVIKDSEGNAVSGEKKWPVNEYTKGFPNMTAGTITNVTASEKDGTVITYSDVSLEQAKSYAKEVRNAGFTKETSEMQNFSDTDEDSYYFIGKNEKGFQTTLILMNGRFVITILKSEEGTN